MASDQRQRRSNQQREVDPGIWRACAGSLIHVPTVNSRVYYFPQGHIEQSSGTVNLSSMVTSRPSILCRVLHVSFLADPDTEEVFVKFHLKPLDPAGFFVEGSGNGDEDENGVVSFAKVLTPSDANNGGGFSVPRFCADSIFPKLDFEADPPVQKIRIVDVHGEGWEFRHIYRGTPRRHLLTTGWSKFVNSKKLIAGDSVVFIRKKLTDELFVGIRRAYRMPPPPPEGEADSSAWAVLPKPAVTTGGFSRANRGRVPPETVVDAAEKAVNAKVFEVVYYPRPGMEEVVVAAEKVEAAQSVYWSSGIRVKMAQETDDGSRLTWYNGTVASVVPASQNGPWSGSSWRMLQVTWDEPEILQKMKMVSPWQVEFIPSTPSIHTTFPPAKKFKGVQNSVLLTDGEGDIPLPLMGFSSMMGQSSPSYINYNIFPAGMQGARQNPFFISTSLPNIMNDGTHQGGPNDNVDMLQKAETVITDLNIGSSPCGTPSPDSQNSVQFFGTAATTEQRSFNLTSKGPTSFQLFGKIIHMEQPLSNTGDVNSMEYDDYTTKGARSRMDDSSSDPYQKSDDSAELQRSSVMDS